MTIRNDIFGNTPSIGCSIVWNPPKYKGLVYGKCVGFAKSGLPLINPDESFKDYFYSWQTNKEGLLTPKTGFCIVK